MKMIPTKLSSKTSTEFISVSQSSTEPLWARTLYMLLFLVIYSIVELVIKASVLIQLIFRLCTGRTQRHLLIFSANLSTYIYAIWRYMTFNDEQLPWPFSSWQKRC